MYLEKKIGHHILKDSVNAIWLSRMTAQDSTFVLPDGTSDIIIKATSSGAKIFLCGVMTETAQMTTTETKEYWALRFNPGYMSLFFKFDNIQNQLIEIDQLFSERLEIEDLMQDPIANSNRIETLVTNQLLKSNDEAEFKNKTKLIQQYSQVQFGRVDLFSKELGVSRRHFSRNFRKYFGYDPRYFSKIKRFNKFLEYTQNHKTQSLSNVALECGFYDQSDLNHTVKEVSGLSPKALMSQLYNT